MNISRFIKTIISVLSLVSLCLFTYPESIIIPGDEHNICMYTDYFYNLPEKDFIYHLNDRLLFSELSDEKLNRRGLRQKLLNIIIVHKNIKKLIQKTNKNDPSNLKLTLKMSDPDGYKKIKKMFNFLGMQLKGDSDKNYLVEKHKATGIIDYYRFSGLESKTIEKQLNKTKFFHYELIESKLPTPWNFKFLGKITGLTISADNFFENMIKNERFSVLLGILYRLSDNEIDFLNGLIKKPEFGAWKKIYENKKFLCGLFALTSAFRVSNNKLILPGGKSAENFWSELAGKNCTESPIEFIEQITTKDEGKLNLLYSFSFFLPENKRKAVFFNYDTRKVQQLYNHISLKKREMLNTSRLPQLRDFNFYTLLFSLRVNNEKIQIPNDVSSWMKAVTGKSQIKSKSKNKKGYDLVFNFLKELLIQSKKDAGKNGIIHKFVSIYSKFFKRPQILTEDTLIELFNNFEKYNIIVDFIEKIPVKKSETIPHLFDFAVNISKTNPGDQELFIAVFQSLLEILSHSSKYATEKYDYDRMVTELTKFSLNRFTLYDRIFQFMNDEMKIPMNNRTIDDNLLNFILAGIKNPRIKIKNTNYKFYVRENYKDLIKDCIQTQEVCSLSDLLNINYLLSQTLQPDRPFSKNDEEELIKTFNLLPYPEFSEEAPKVIQDRVFLYSINKMNRDIKNLAQLINNRSPVNKIKYTIDKL